MYMNDGTRPCSNAQIKNDGGEESIAFLGKTQLAARDSVPYPHPDMARTRRQHIGKQIPLYFYGAEKHGIQSY